MITAVTPSSSELFTQFMQMVPVKLPEGCLKAIHAVINQPGVAQCKIKKNPNGSECSFWVFLGDDSSIRIHRPNSVIGKGAFKRVKSAVELLLLKNQCFEWVRLMPADKQQGWHQNALQGFYNQEFLYDALKHRGELSCIAMPPIAVDKDELLQPLYPMRLQGLKGDRAILSEFSILFSTIDGIHRHGYIHCDLKPDNLQLTSDCRIVLNDFDHSGTSFHGVTYAYEFWDIATQNGLRNPYADVVGGIVCLLFTLFHGKYKELNFENDTAHSIFKGPNAVSDVSKLLEATEGPQMRAIELACKVFQAEDRIYAAIVSSLVYNCMKVGRRDMQAINRFSFDAAFRGILSYVGMRFSEPHLGLAAFLKSAGHPISINNLAVLTDFVTAKEQNIECKDLSEFEKLLEQFYSTASPAILSKLQAIPFIGRSMLALIKDEALMSSLDFNSVDEQLFLQLISRNPDERMNGHTTLKTIAPSALDVQLAIQAILT